MHGFFENFHRRVEAAVENGGERDAVLIRCDDQLVHAFERHFQRFFDDDVFAGAVMVGSCDFQTGARKAKR